jgi:hypothetical protein
MCFRDGATADRVLHAPYPSSVELTLIFSRFTWQVGPLFSPLRYKVLSSIENLPAHTWSISTAQEVLGSYALIFDVSSASSSGSDLSQFLVAAWAKQLGHILNEMVVSSRNQWSCLLSVHRRCSSVSWKWSTPGVIHSSSASSFMYWKSTTTQLRRSPTMTPLTLVATPIVMATLGL